MQASREGEDGKLKKSKKKVKKSKKKVKMDSRTTKRDSLCLNLTAVARQAEESNETNEQVLKQIANKQFISCPI